MSDIEKLEQTIFIQKSLIEHLEENIKVKDDEIIRLKAKNFAYQFDRTKISDLEKRNAELEILIKKEKIVTDMNVSFLKQLFDYVKKNYLDFADLTKPSDLNHDGLHYSTYDDESLFCEKYKRKYHPDRKENAILSKLYDSDSYGEH